MVWRSPTPNRIRIDADSDQVEQLKEQIEKEVFQDSDMKKSLDELSDTLDELAKDLDGDERITVEATRIKTFR